MKQPKRTREELDAVLALARLRGLRVRPPNASCELIIYRQHEGYNGYHSILRLRVYKNHFVLRRPRKWGELSVKELLLKLSKVPS